MRGRPAVFLLLIRSLSSRSPTGRIRPLSSLDILINNNDDYLFGCGPVKLGGLVALAAGADRSRQNGGEA